MTAYRQVQYPNPFHMLYNALMEIAYKSGIKRVDNNHINPHHASAFRIGAGLGCNGGINDTSIL
jgi:hypothetical protein